MATIPYLEEREVPTGQPLDLTPYPIADEITAPHPMRALNHSPFCAWFCDLMQDSRMRIEVACGGFAALGFLLIVGRVMAAYIAGRH